MPTKHPRIAVTCDEELAAALARVEALSGSSSVQRARLVRELALRGAQLLVDEEDERAELLRRLAEQSTGTRSLFDRDVLARIDEAAWGSATETG